MRDSEVSSYGAFNDLVEERPEVATKDSILKTKWMGGGGGGNKNNEWILGLRWMMANIFQERVWEIKNDSGPIRA